MARVINNIELIQGVIRQDQFISIIFKDRFRQTLRQVRAMLMDKIQEEAKGLRSYKMRGESLKKRLVNNVGIKLLQYRLLIDLFFCISGEGLHC